MATFTGSLICSACGHIGEKRGYGCLEVGLFLFLCLFFLIPGIIYALVLDNRAKRCPSCGQDAMIPITSPRGQKLVADMGGTVEK